MSIDRTVAATVSKELRFVGPKFAGKGYTSMVIKPADEGGIRFNTPAGVIPVNSDYVHPHKKNFSHILVLANRQVERLTLSDWRVMVPEHLLAAISLAGINHAEIDIYNKVMEDDEKRPLPLHVVFGKIPSKWQVVSVPISTSNSSEFYNALINNRKIIGGTNPPNYVITKGYLTGQVSFFPSDTLDIIIMGMPNDKYRLFPKNFEAKDIYNADVSHTAARALSRPPKYINWPCIKWMIEDSLDFFYGILNSEYIKINKNSSHEEKLALMQEQYRGGHNEQFAHLVYSDFMGELFAMFPGNIKGRIVIYNTGNGHTGRITALREIIDQGVIQKR